MEAEEVHERAMERLMRDHKEAMRMKGVRE